MEAVTDTLEAPDPAQTTMSGPRFAAPGRSLRLPGRRTLILLGLAWIGLASIVAVRQPPSGDPLQPTGPSHFGWWWRPIERNPLLRLPATGEVNRLARHPDTGHLFGVGRAGLVVRSTDGGHTWEQRPVDWTPSDQPAATRTQTTAQLLRDDVMRASFDVPKGRAQQQQQQTAPPYDDEKKSAPNLDSTPTATKSNVGDVAPIAPVAKPRPYADLLDIAFAPGGRGWIVGESDTVLVTEDRGATWQLGAPGSNAGFGSTVTTSWHLPTPPPFEDVSAQFSNDAREAWAGDRAGRVHYTTDAGASWETRQLPLPQAVRSLVASNTVVIAALDDYGLAKSEDGGDSWSLLCAPLVRAAHFRPDGLHGWAVGEHGLMLSTSDGGLSWSSESSGTTSTLHDVQFLDDGQRGWAVGDQGVVLMTTNGGMS